MSLRQVFTDSGSYVLGAQKNRLIEMSFLSTHNMFWLRNKENNFLVHTLTWRPVYYRIMSYHCHISVLVSLLNSRKTVCIQTLSPLQEI